MKNSEDPFISIEQESKLLVFELQEIKESLKEIGRAIVKIELRAKRAYPTAFPIKNKLISAEKSSISSNKPDMSIEQVIKFYDDMVLQAREGQIEIVKLRLGEVSTPDLNLLRKELGIFLKSSKPTKPTLIKAILGRISESLLISKHTNR